jgi:hypothetical protein
MRRRNFIKMSSLSITGLLIADFSKAGGKKNTVIQMPGKVEILSGDQYYALQSSDQYTWKYKDVIVELKKLTDKIEVFAQSPSMALKEIKLSWKYTTPGTATILGDAWESIVLLMIAITQFVLV